MIRDTRRIVLSTNSAWRNIGYVKPIKKSSNAAQKSIRESSHVDAQAHVFSGKHRKHKAAQVEENDVSVTEALFHASKGIHTGILPRHIKRTVWATGHV